MIDKKKKYNTGEMEIGMIMLLLIVALFIIWVLTGGSKTHPDSQKPFIRPYTDPVAPLETYGPNEK
jgi:hypothetical protein